MNTVAYTSQKQYCSPSSGSSSMKRISSSPGSPSSRRRAMRSTVEKKQRMTAKSASGGLPVKSKGTTDALSKPARNLTGLKAPSTSISKSNILSYTSNWGSATSHVSTVWSRPCENQNPSDNFMIALTKIKRFIAYRRCLL